MNRAILIGRLTKDPELRSTPTGRNVCQFSIAVNRNYTTASGEREADFINCVVWDKQAENLSKYQKKGNQIAVEGRIQTRNYDAQDGSKRYVTEVVVENVEFVGGKNENSSSAPSNDYVDAPSEAPIDDMPEYDIPASDPYENYDKEVSLSDNDLPF